LARLDVLEMTAYAVITVRLDPELTLGPIAIAWHGLTIAVGVLVGWVAAARWLRREGLETDPLWSIVPLVAVGGMVGGRLFYLLETDPAALLRPGELFGDRGFTFAGGVILAGLLLVVYARVRRLGARYVDAVAVGFPLGVAVGRIGDLINGEHYGPRTDFFLAVRNAHPDALTPNPALAYHSGGLYEVILAAAIFAFVWPLRHRLRRPGDLAWLVLGLFAIGRFIEFFVRSDSPPLALGLNIAQWTSLALAVAAALGWTLTSRRAGGERKVATARAGA
jgi:phosphatidylglycerol:prolipoprotein diacylglycerol transferase